MSFEKNIEKIIDSIKRISIDVNRYRQILPGNPYLPPPSEDRHDADTTGRAELTELFGQSADSDPERFFTGHFFGLSPAFAREVLQDLYTYRQKRGWLAKVYEKLVACVEKQDKLDPTVAAAVPARVRRIASLCS